jgi:transcriptional regulator with XRE-family HTH domain
MDTKHPLAVWMDGHKEISQAKLASDCRCSEPHLSLILKGERGVSMKLAKRLSEATGGAVRIEDFVMADEAAGARA